MYVRTPLFLQIVPFFEVCLKLPSQNASAALAEGSTKVTTSVLVGYIAGVLATFTKVGTISYYFQAATVD